MKYVQHIILVFFVAILLTGCVAGEDNPGREFAPNMYHSTPYEPLSQIKDKDYTWADSNPDDGHTEFYNSNPYNEFEMTMIRPVEGTVRRGQYLPYRLEKDSVDQSVDLAIPFEVTENVVSEGKALYARFCQHCHGETGQGDGLVGQVYLGVPAYNVGTTKDLPAGHIFHVITHGIRRMGAHGSQISEEERWKIVTYVQKLQKQ